MPPSTDCELSKGTDSKPPLSDYEFFKETRDYIKHEDTLINHRITWLITLQAFLFGAYGFSLSSEASFTQARATIERSNHESSTTSSPAVGHQAPLPLMEARQVTERVDFVLNARAGMAWLGLVSALVMCFPLIAAGQSMRTAVKRWESYIGKKSELFPGIIGSWNFKRGLSIGLVPLAGLPLACIAAWAKLQDSFWIGVGALFGAGLITILSIGTDRVWMYLILKIKPKVARK